MGTDKVMARLQLTEAKLATAEAALQSANERAAHWARENSEKQKLFDEAIAQRDAANERVERADKVGMQLSEELNEQVNLRKAAEARLALPELKAEGFEDVAILLEQVDHVVSTHLGIHAMMEGPQPYLRNLPRLPQSLQNLNLALEAARTALHTKSGLGEELERAKRQPPFTEDPEYSEGWNDALDSVIAHLRSLGESKDSDSGKENQ
jgi:hypothetical protein